MTYSDVATAIVRSVDITGGHLPRVLVYGPVAQGNPYQALLYSGMWSRGIAPIPSPDLDALGAASVAIDAGGTAAVHLHWLSSLAMKSDSAADYDRRCGELLDLIDGLRSIGVKFVWTIHNALEHEAPFPAREIALRSRLSSVADVIHLMSDLALPEIAQHYALDPARIVVVPHPSYVGAYPEYASQLGARVRYGLRHDELVIGVLGALRPYKRIDEVHAACRQARAAGRAVRLICAGAADERDAVVSRALANVRSDPWTTVVTGVLHDREMAELVVACDVVSCAYDSPLASGVAMLAMSLRRPVILPDRPVSRELAGDGAVYVDVAQPGALAECIGQLDRADLTHRGEFARKRAELSRFDVVADQFADIVEPLLVPDE